MADTENTPPPIGHNGLTQDAFERHVSAILRNRNGPLAMAKAAVKGATKVEKDLKAAAKTSGIKLVQLEAYLKLREMESEDDASENAQAFVQYCKWGELIEGEQGDLFDGLSPTPSEASDRWHKRGFSDIREGKLDPEGYLNVATGKREPAALMPSDPPSYVPAEFKTDWMAGAYEADDLNNADFLAKQESLKTTPVEKAAKPPKVKPEPKTPDAPAEKPKSQKDIDLEKSAQNAKELAAKGATSAEFGNDTVQ